jgi:CBS domain-containing protein
MGKLLPGYGNVTYTTSSQLSPLINDPYLETIGFGTRIFLGGAKGYVIGEGTQYNTEVPRKNNIPVGPAGTLAVKCNLKDCNPKYLKGASFEKYGVSLYVGIGIPIPILNEDIAKKTAIKDGDIYTKVLDYSIKSRSRPALKEVSYAELRSGKIELNGKEVRTSSMAPLKTAREIADLLKKQIEKGDFVISEPLEHFPKTGFKPLKHDVKYVKDAMRKATTISHDTSVEEVSKLLIGKGVNHIPILKEGKLDGIVTSWDIAKAVSEGKKELRDAAVRNVITAQKNETLGIVAERLRKKGISALPVVENGKVLGIITAEDIARFVNSG